jgi:hypothetical protein
MARFARVIAAGIPHHITQRGNARHRSSPARSKEKPNAAWRPKNADPGRRPIGARTRRHFPWRLVGRLYLVEPFRLAPKPSMRNRKE